MRRAITVGLLTASGSRAVVAASLGWLVVLGSVYASDAGPPMPAMAFTSALLFPVAAWASSAQLSATSPDLRLVLTAAYGRGRVLVADAVPPLLWVGAASTLAALATYLFDSHRTTWPHRLLGLGFHLVIGSSGAALALALHARRLSRGASALALVGAAMLSVLLPWLPPEGPVLSTWSEPKRVATTFELTWVVLGPLVVTGALAALAWTWRRRRL